MLLSLEEQMLLEITGKSETMKEYESKYFIDSVQMPKENWKREYLKDDSRKNYDSILESIMTRCGLKEVLDDPKLTDSRQYICENIPPRDSQIKNNTYFSGNYFRRLQENNSDVRELQRDLESILRDTRRNVPRIDRDNLLREEDLLSNLLDNTKLLGKDHTPEYFNIQARIILGKKDFALKIALSLFQENLCDGQFGVKYLKDFLKQDVEMNEAELGRYALRQDIQLSGSQYGKFFSSKYFDTTFNFCLTYDDELIASVGFNACSGRIFIEQVQGIAGYGNQLKPIKWERALVNYTLEWAKHHQIPEVAIISVDNHTWANQEGHLDKEKGKMLYDVTAKRCGFKERDEKGNYVQRLHTLKIDPQMITQSELLEAVNF